MTRALAGVVATAVVLLGRAGIAAAQATTAAPLPEPCGTPADDDASTKNARAGEHYRRGQELYAEGEYEGAIVEFRAAYCLVPVPEPVYNVAQAYERLVDYERAVQWFEYYIRALPADAEEERETVGNRVSVLRRLPARLRVATDPTGARIVLQGGTTPITGMANAKDPLRVPAGQYVMRVELSGYEPIVVDPLVAEIGQPYTYSFRLSPLTSPLRVTTEPGDARIFVDKKLVGVGNYQEELPVGSHEVTVEASDRPPETRFVKVEADQASTLHVKLPPLPKSGITELLTATTVFGLASGAVLADTIGTTSTPLTGAIWVAGGVIGYAGISLGAPKNIPVGSTSFIIGSAAWGTLEGIGVGISFTEDPNILGAVGIGAATAAAVGAAATAPTFDFSAGDAALINSGGTWGAAAAGLFIAAFDADQHGLSGPILLTGLNAGLLSGVLLSRRYEYSRGHVALIDLSGLGGILAGVSVSNAFTQEGQADRTAHFALGGMGLGLVTGALLTRNMDKRGGLASAAPRYTPVATSGEDRDGHAVPLWGVAGTW